MQAAAFTKFGEPAVLTLQTLPDPEPGPGDVLVRTQAMGLNFADIYRRRGEYTLVPPSPYVLGYEGAGVVDKLGPGVRGVKIGDRVAFVDVPRANAELVVAPFEKVIPLPDDIPFQIAAAALLQGLTAQYLTEETHPVQAGETVLVHAASGGVGLFLVQLAKLRGARVIGIVSSRSKADAVLESGADETIDSSSSDFLQVTRELTGGKGADVVYDSVGTTLNKSIAAVKGRGHVVFFGWAGGRPALVDPRSLMEGSKRLSGGDLWDHLTTRDLRVHRAHQLLHWLRLKKIHLRLDSIFGLSKISEAHGRLESRMSIGKILLVPG